MLFRVRSAAWLVGGVLAAGLSAAGCGSSYSSPTGPTPTPATGGATADVTVTITGMNGANSFSPSLARVAVGQTVAWRNADGIAHTATGQGFDTGAIAPGTTSAPIQFNNAALYAYRCTVHPTMTASVQVGSSTTRVGY